MINNEAMRKYLKEQVSRDLIIKYMFIKSKEEKYSDEYIQKKYKINALKIRALYKALDKEEVGRLEKTIINQIETGEINLDEQAVIWYKQYLANHKNKTQSNKEKEEH